MSVRTWSQQPRYRIRRFYMRHGSRLVRGLSGLTLEQAQAHCADLNTSSRMAWKTSAVKRTQRYGQWFDRYEEMP